MSKTILLFICVLALASTLDFTLDQDFFFVGTNNRFHSTLYQTSSHVIAQSVEFPSIDQPVIQYVAFDLTTGNATQILADVSAACDPHPYAFSKLIYHDSSDKLVYYCANNNTILFIDQEGFKVMDTIIVSGTNIYTETRLTSDGDFLVILGINDFFGKEATNTQFIRVNLITREVTSDFSFNGIVSADQTVVAYASNKLESYVIATQSQNMSETAYLYLLVLNKDIFKLVPVMNYNYNTNGTTIIHHLHCIGEYVATNSATDLIFVNQLGNIVQNFSNLTSSRIYTNKSNYALELSYGMQYGSTDLYLLFNNDTLTRVTVSPVLATQIGTAAQMMLVIGKTSQDDLLFILGDQGPIFSVVQASTMTPVYTRPNGYRNLMRTDSTYAAEQSPYLFIFDSSKNTIVANVTIGLYYFYDTDNGLVYFLNKTDSTTCQIISIDLTSGQYAMIFQFPDVTACAGEITNVDSSSNPPQVAISVPGNNTLLALTKSNGLLTFTPPTPSSGFYAVAYSFINFDNLNLEFISSQDSQTYTVDMYTYDQSSKTFVSGLSYNFDMNSAYPLYNIYTVGSSEIVAISKQSFIDLEVSATKPTTYNLPYLRAQMSMFTDKSGNTYMILTENPNYNLITSAVPPFLFSSGNLVQLEGTSSATTQAGAAGSCSYWFVDGMITSVGIVKFYVCDFSHETIYA